MLPPIGISGAARAGKNTFADYLMRALVSRGYSVQTVAFADPLRGILAATDPIIGNSGTRLSDVLHDAGGWEGAKDTVYGPEIRRLLQRLGTEGVRKVDSQFWLRTLSRTVVASANIVTIVPDVRFPNEDELITDLGGLTVHVSRPSLAYTDDHTSETYSPLLRWGADVQVTNFEDDLDYLRGRADDVAHRYTNIYVRNFL